MGRFVRLLLGGVVGLKSEERSVYLLIRLDIDTSAVDLLLCIAVYGFLVCVVERSMCSYLIMMRHDMASILL